MTQENTTEQKYEQKGPEIKTVVRKSNDGQWIIHETIITDIKHVNYFKQVMDAEPKN